MNFDQLDLSTIPAPQPIRPLIDERIPVNDDTRGDAEHIEAARAYAAQLRTNREATPVALYNATECSEL